MICTSCMQLLKRLFLVSRNWAFVDLGLRNGGPLTIGNLAVSRNNSAVVVLYFLDPCFLFFLSTYCNGVLIVFSFNRLHNMNHLL